MSIKSLVEYLQTIPADQLGDVGEKLALERVVYPTDWEDGEIEVRQADLLNTSGFNLRLGGSTKKESSEVSSLLASLLDRVRGMRFASGEFRVGAEVYWPKDTFVQEHDLGSLTRVSLCGSFFTRDASKMRVNLKGTPFFRQLF